MTDGHTTTVYTALAAQPRRAIKVDDCRVKVRSHIRCALLRCATGKTLLSPHQIRLLLTIVRVYKSYLLTYVYQRSAEARSPCPAHA